MERDKGVNPGVSPGKIDRIGSLDGETRTSDDKTNFKQAKGIITRKAMESQLQKKLQNADPSAGEVSRKPGDKEGLKSLQKKDKDIKIQEEQQQDFWQQIIVNKKEELVKQREEQDAELQELLNDNKDDGDDHGGEDSDDEYQETEVLRKKLEAFKTAGHKESKVDPRWQISIKRPWRRAWNYLIIAAALYSTVIIPIQIGVNTEVLGAAYLPIDIFTYVLYVADLVINLRTTYIDNFGEEIRDDWKIAKKYVAGPSFWIDFFSLWAAPGVSNKLIQPLGILKLNRLLRLLGLISESNMDKDRKSFLTILYYFGILIIYLHITGCLWFVIIHKTYLMSDDFYDHLQSIGVDPDFEKVGIVAWIPPYDFFDGSGKFWHKYEEGNTWFVYSVCLYYATLVIGGNEMGPKESSELLFCVAINLIGAIFNSYIFGELAVLLATTDQKDSQFQEVLDTANTAMANIKLDEGLRVDIREYFKRVQQTMTQQDETKQLLKRVSPSLKKKVQSCMFSKMLEGNKAIKATKAMIMASIDKDLNLARKMTPRPQKSPVSSQNNREELFLPVIVDNLGTELPLPEDVVVSQDDFPEKAQEQVMFFLIKGNCTVTVRAEANKDTPKVRTLDIGDHFGEIHLLYRCARSATVRSNNYNTLARLKYDNFKDLISEFPEYEQCLRDHVINTYGIPKPGQTNERKGKPPVVDPRIAFLNQTIKRVEYLKNISDPIFFDIMFSLKPLKCEKDQLVLAEDSSADSLMFIEEGCLEVYTSFEGNEFVIERLHRGSAINSNAFFMRDSMYVNVRCTKESKVLLLSLESMKAIMGKYADKDKFNNEMLYYQNKILKLEKKFPLDYIMQIPPTERGVVDEGMARRENTLKNVVMNIVIKIRERKKRPKLSDFMAVYRTKQGDANAKEMFQKKFRMLYSGEPIENNVEDAKYNKLAETLMRVQRLLSEQQMHLSLLVKRVNNLSDKRDKRQEKKNKAKLEGKSGPNQDIRVHRGKDKGNVTSQSSKNQLVSRDKQIIEDAEEDISVDAVETRRQAEIQRVDRQYQQKPNESENIQQMLKLSNKKAKEDQEFAKIRSGQLNNLVSDRSESRTYDEGEDTSRATGQENMRLINSRGGQASDRAEDDTEAGRSQQ